MRIILLVLSSRMENVSGKRYRSNEEEKFDKADEADDTQSIKFGDVLIYTRPKSWRESPEYHVLNPKFLSEKDREVLINLINGKSEIEHLIERGNMGFCLPEDAFDFKNLFESIPDDHENACKFYYRLYAAIPEGGLKTAPRCIIQVAVET